VLIVHAVDDAHRARGDEVARHHGKLGASHRRVGQPLAERGLDVEAQLAGGFLGTFQRGIVGDAHAFRVLRLDIAQRQLFFHLRSRAEHQHDLHAHRVQQRHVVDQRVEHPGLDQFAAEGDHEGLAAEGVDIGRDGAQPVDELLLVRATGLGKLGGDGRILGVGRGLYGQRERGGGRIGVLLRGVGSGVHAADYNPGQCQHNAPPNLFRPGPPRPRLPRFLESRQRPAEAAARARPPGGPRQPRAPQPARLANPMPEIAFPEACPSRPARRDRPALQANQVVIVCGETGSGKTTQLPKIACRSGGARRARASRRRADRPHPAAPDRRHLHGQAHRQELGTPLGETVGYRCGSTTRCRPGASVKLMTDGILLAETQNDPLLRAYDTIIIDEAHERSLNIDFLLGYLRQILPRGRT
jgi:hypothetical protein